jgi:hypothetical protein
MLLLVHIVNIRLYNFQTYLKRRNISGEVEDALANIKNQINFLDNIYVSIPIKVL